MFSQNLTLAVSAFESKVKQALARLRNRWAPARLFSILYSYQVARISFLFGVAGAVCLAFPVFGVGPANECTRLSPRGGAVWPHSLGPYPGP